MNSFPERKIIFDMDGVITSEERYWDAAALTVWELLCSERYLGLERSSPTLSSAFSAAAASFSSPELPGFKTNPTIQEIASIRRTIFCADKVIRFFKARAVNSNWDLAYLTFCFHLFSLVQHLADRNEDSWKPSFDALLLDWAGDARGEELMKRLLALFPAGLEYRLGHGYDQSPDDTNTYLPFSATPLWKDMQEIFQEWYYGEKMFRELFRKEPGNHGKAPLYEKETPLIEVEKIKTVLSQLSSRGWKLGIATGRPTNELFYPLQSMGLWEYFQPDSVVTFDKVVQTENSLKGVLPSLTLGKPHPYPFLKAYWGELKRDEDLIAPPYPAPPPGMCWAVGDTMADLLAARQAGAAFIGVLSGAISPDNSDLFEKEGADAVLPDLTFLPDFLRY